jgi:hypothetical protein
MRNIAIVLLFALGVSACGGGYSQQAKDAAFRTAKNAKANTLVFHSYPTTFRKRGGAAHLHTPVSVGLNDWPVKVEKGGIKTFSMIDGGNRLYTDTSEALLYPDNSEPIFIVEYPPEEDFAQFSRSDFERIISGSFDIDAYFVKNRYVLSARTSKAFTERTKREKEIAAARKLEQRRELMVAFKNQCLVYGISEGSIEMAKCVKDLDIAKKQNDAMDEMKARVEMAERRASAANAAAEKAEKEASRASTQAIISNTIANQAKRDANTIPYGKDCPWLSGCKK